MAVTESSSAVMEAQTAAPGSTARTSLLVCLGSAFQEASLDALQPLLSKLETALSESAVPMEKAVVVYPGSSSDDTPVQTGRFQVHTYQQGVPATMVAIQPASTWVSTYEQMRTHGSDAALLLGAEAESLSADAMQKLAEAVLQGKSDLAVPRYALPSNQGLLNAAVLSPLSRALYGAKVQFPLALDYGLSARMAGKLAASAQRFTAANQGDAIVWPVAEAANAGYEIAEVLAGPRELPQLNNDLSQILHTVVGSLFSDVEQRAAFWQRTRPARDVSLSGGTSAETRSAPDPEHRIDEQEIDSLLETFRNGYRNLQEIWSLVLPPNTLVALKRLSVAPRESFALPDTLWVRVVYDFVLAHRLRTLARNHLMGAMAPLYLAWVASHVLGSQSGRGDSSEDLARAFEADKPYLVSRWRWPDRFNP